MPSLGPGPKYPDLRLQRCGVKVVVGEAPASSASEGATSDHKGETVAGYFKLTGHMETFAVSGAPTIVSNGTRHNASDMNRSLLVGIKSH